MCPIGLWKRVCRKAIERLAATGRGRRGRPADDDVDDIGALDDHPVEIGQRVMPLVGEGRRRGADSEEEGEGYPFHEAG